MNVRQLVELLEHCNPDHDVRVKGFNRPVLYESYDSEAKEAFVCISDAVGRAAEPEKWPFGDPIPDTYDAILRPGAFQGHCDEKPKETA